MVGVAPLRPLVNRTRGHLPGFGEEIGASTLAAGFLTSPTVAYDRTTNSSGPPCSTVTS